MYPPSAFRSFGKHVNPSLAQFLTLSGRDQHFVRAEGCTLVTRDGETYKDWIAGFGSLNLGHNPHWLLDCLQDHLQSRSPNLYMESLNPFSGVLAKQLIRAAAEDHFETCFFCNSGSESVEAAIKLAIAATGRRAILYAEGGYHGTTMGALSMMAAGVYRSRFEPLLPDFHQVRWNDLESLSNLLAEKQPAAFVLEPIQIEAGVRCLDSGYLQRAAELGHRHGALLILDEVQTGMGRTGELFAFQSANVLPDIIALGKSLGGGLMPIGAVLMAHGLFERAYGDFLSCEIHNSTFGGNALACRAAMEVLSQLSQPPLLSAVRERSQYLEQSIRSVLETHPLVSRIFFIGLLGGITLRNVEHPWFSWKNLGAEHFDELPVTGPLLVHRMYKRKMLVQVCAHDWSTLRIEPPLIVSNDECDEFVSALKAELDWISSNS